MPGHGRLGLTPDGATWLPSGVEVYLGKPFVYPQESHIGKWIADGHEWDAQFRTTVPALLPEDEPLIVEVGSNIGASLLQILAVKPRARVLAFEPSNLFRAFLECNLELAGAADVEVRPLLVGARGGYGSIHINGTTGSRQPLDGTRAQPAPMTTLDDASRERRVDFLKVDTDGFEFDVLRGGEATLRRDWPAVHFELVPYRMLTDPATELAWLQELGYRRLVCLHPGGPLLGETTDPGRAIAWADEFTYIDILACAVGSPPDARLTALLASDSLPRWPATA